MQDNNFFKSTSTGGRFQPYSIVIWLYFYANTRLVSVLIDSAPSHHFFSMQFTLRSALFQQVNDFRLLATNTNGQHHHRFS